MLKRWMRPFFADDGSVVELQYRAGWLAFVLILQTDANIPALAFSSSLFPFLLLLGSFLAMWMAFGPHSLRQLMQPLQRYLGLMKFLILFFTMITAVVGSILLIVIIQMCFSPPQFFDDGTALDTNAAVLLLEGQNPYAASNILNVAQRFHIQALWTTPLRRGRFADQLEYPGPGELQSVFALDLKSGQATEFESKVSYPALSFLVLVPFVLLQDYNVLPLSLFGYLLLVFIAWKTSRLELRPWILLLSVANVPLWAMVIGGSMDTLYALFVVLAWLFRDRRWVSACCFGLALASKQLAWFFVPFYILLLGRHYSWREAIFRLTIAANICLVINLPFILWNPGAWVDGILAPVADPMFPLGVGLVRLSISHMLPFFPSWISFLLESGAAILSLIWYWRICRARPEAAMLLAVFPLFFAWRSLLSYFSCAAYQLFVLMAAKTLPGVYVHPEVDIVAPIEARKG